LNSILPKIEMNWIFLGCLVFSGPIALVIAKCSVQHPQCVGIDDGQKTLQPSDFGCGRCYADATANSITEPDTWIPKCNFAKGWFLKEQFNSAKNESFCVDKFGNEFVKSRVKGNKVRCSGYKDSLPKSKCQIQATQAVKFKGKFIPKCTKKGNFAALQCYDKGEWCWCVERGGSAIPKTFFNTKWHKDKIPNCPLLRGVKVICNAGSGTKQHPLDCSRYFVCAPQRIFHCTCAEGQRYDEKKSICNWASKVKCPKLKVKPNPNSSGDDRQIVMMILPKPTQP